MLSGGQKQRLAIARALIRDPKILLLDEPTSELDVENANRILDILFDLSRTKTVILITHHIQSIERAHKIHFLQAGKLEEAGTHAQLVQQQVRNGHS
jgi:ABC-type bacteriocin/lantibiotic exporter with double-glycine peptidase domain